MQQATNVTLSSSNKTKVKQEAVAQINNASLKSPPKGTRTRKQTDEIKQSPTQKGKRVIKETAIEAVSVIDPRPTRGTRARLNTNNADNPNKMSLSPKNNGKGSKPSNIVSQSKREISMETISRSSRRAKVESSATVTQSPKRRKRKMDQLIVENQPAEKALKPKRIRNAEQQVPFVEKKLLKQKTNQTKIQESEPSPKKTRRAKVTVETPVKDPPSRRNKTEDKVVSNIKKRRTSLAIGKKPPVMSPQVVTGRRKGDNQISPITESSQRAMSTRRMKSEVKLVSPKAVKTTRAKVIVVTPSKKTYSRGKTRAHTQGPTKESPKTSLPENTRRGRRNAGKPEQNTFPIRSKGRSYVEQENKPDSPKKGRRNAGKPEENTFSGQSKVRSEVERESKPDSPKKRGRRTANKSVIVGEPPKKRSRKITEKPEEKEKTIEKSTSVDTYPKRVRIAKSNVTQPVKVVTKPQGKKVQESVQSEPGKRSRRTKVEGTSVVAETRKGRKRKIEEEHVVPAKVAKSDAKVPSGRKTTKTTDVTNARSASGRQKRSTKDNKAETLKDEKLKDNKTTRTQKNTKVAKESTKMKPKVTQPAKGNKVRLVII